MKSSSTRRIIVPAPPNKTAFNDLTPEQKKVELEKRSKQSCQAFARGRCRFGDRCHYSHAKDNKTEDRSMKTGACTLLEDPSSDAEDGVYFTLAATPQIDEEPAIKEWVIDTGSENHLVCADHVSPSAADTRKLDRPLRLATANGEIKVDTRVKHTVPELGMTVDPLVLPNTVDALSVGRLVLDNDFSFHWPNGQEAYFVRGADGEVTRCTTKGYVPILPATLPPAEPALPGIPINHDAVDDDDHEVRPHDSKITRELKEAQRRRATEKLERTVAKHENPGDNNFKNLRASDTPYPVHPDCDPEATPGDRAHALKENDTALKDLKTDARKNAEETSRKTESDKLRKLHDLQDAHSMTDSERQRRIKELTMEVRRESGQGQDPLVHSDSAGPDEDQGATEKMKLEAASVRHAMTHRPKNPWCWVCMRSKMISKYALRCKDGVKSIQPEYFGHLLCADHIIIGKSDDAGLAGERAGLIVMDVFTKLIGLYPVANKTAREAVIALRHFAGDAQVKFLYTDDSPELAAAANELGWAHQIDPIQASEQFPYRETSEEAG